MFYIEFSFMGYTVLCYSTMRLHQKISLSKSTSTTEDTTDCKRVVREKKENQFPLKRRIYAKTRH